jgi:hypothetical protein
MKDFIVKKEWPKIEEGERTEGIIPAITEGHMEAPALYVNTDYSTFSKGNKEKGEILTAKFHHKKELQKYYGSIGKNWKKYLNIPSHSFPTIKISF